MLKHYFKTALRFLWQNKLYTGINALGLSISLAVSFIILLFVINEFSYNHCHKNRKKAFLVINYHKEYKASGPGTPYILAKALKEEFPQIEKAVNIGSLGGFKLKLSEEYINVSEAIATHSEVFDIFTMPLIGTPFYKDLLKDKNSIVLSQEMADKFFPGEDPVGKEIEGFINNLEQVFIVSGVFEDIPRNSTFQADCFVNSKWRVSGMNKAYGRTDIGVDWDAFSWITWILLSDNDEATLLEEQFEAFEKKYIGEDSPYHYSLRNLSDIYFKSNDLRGAGDLGNIKNIRLFSAVAFLIVLISAINYIILSIAVSTGRAKEVGIRKTAGASIARIRNQLLSESIMLTLLVLPVAILLIWLTIPSAEKLFQTSLGIIPGNIGVYIPVYLLLTLFIGIASGIYTSSYLSRLKVLDVINQKITFGKRRKFFRSSLIVIQLVIFCFFVSGTLLIRSQLQFALEKDPGHYKEHILQVDLGRDFKGYSAFLNGIKSIPHVIMAAGTADGLPKKGTGGYMQPHYQDKEVKIKVAVFSIDYNLLETLGIAIVEGRDFSVDYGSDLTHAIILNETAVKKLGIIDPIGQKMGDEVEERKIIGVVKDFHLNSIHTEIPPLNIRLTDKHIRHILVRYHPGTLTDLIPALKSEWEKVEPDRPFSYSMIEDLFLEVYSSEKKLSTILSISALFALLISALGLFGLTLFTARSRTKEIGIKKVLGSSGNAIVYSFLRSNIIMVIAAALLSVPITYYFMLKWLDNFPYKVGIGWWIFVVAFVIAAIVVLSTVIIQSLKASRLNPVDSLRYE